MDYGKQHNYPAQFKQFSVLSLYETIKLPSNENHQSRGTYRQWHFFMEEIRKILSILNKKQELYYDTMKSYHTKSFNELEKLKSTQVKYIKDEQQCFQNLKRYKKQNFYDAKSFIMKMFLRCSQIFQISHGKLQQLGLQNMQEAYDNAKQQMNNIYCKSLLSRKHSCLQLLEKMAKTQSQRIKLVINKLIRLKQARTLDQSIDANSFKRQSRFRREDAQIDKVDVSNSFFEKLKCFREKERKFPKTVVLCQPKPLFSRCQTTGKFKSVNIESNYNQNGSCQKKQSFIMRKPVIQNSQINTSIQQFKKASNSLLKLKKIGTLTHNSLNISTVDSSMNYNKDYCQKNNFDELFNILDIQQIRIKQIQNNCKRYQRDSFRRNKYTLYAYHLWANSFSQHYKNFNPN